MLEIYPIKSSSKGNCFIVGDGDDMIILDVGITKDEFDFGLLKYGDLIDPYKIKGIFITHSHADHWKGVKSISDHYKLTVYSTQETYDTINKNGNQFYKYSSMYPFKAIQANNLTITALDINHSNSDGSDCLGAVNFVVKNTKEERLAYLTDCGSIDYNIKDCEIYLIEANYSKEMTKINSFHQERSTSSKGHLSLEYSVDYLVENIGSKTKDIVLIHLSNSGSEHNSWELYTKNKIKDKNITVLEPDKFIDKPIIIGKKEVKSLY